MFYNRVAALRLATRGGRGILKDKNLILFIKYIEAELTFSFINKYKSKKCRVISKRIRLISNHCPMPVYQEEALCQKAGVCNYNILEKVIKLVLLSC